MMYKDIIKDHISSLEYVTGVYKMYGEGTVLYVGKAKDLKNRLMSYLRYDSLSNRIKNMVKKIDKIETIEANSETEALLLESRLIKSLMPKYNILLRDDKTYPYIRISRKHDFPRIMRYRNREKSDELIDCYGPYVSSNEVDEVIKVMQSIYKIRTCSDTFFANRQRACIKYQVGKCSAPCVNLINKEDYSKDVSKVRDILNGKSSVVQKELMKKMEEASKEMEFARAKMYRDRIYALQKIQIQYSINEKDGDYVSLYRQGDSCIVGCINIRNGNAILRSKCKIDGVVSEITEGEILKNFLQQEYYNVNDHRIVYALHAVHEKELLELALSISIYYTKDSIAISKLSEILRNECKEFIMEKDILNRLFDLFSLKALPKVIEVFDNSHIVGCAGVGAIVSWSRGEFNKKDYRKYKIDGCKGDDYAMMRKVMYKRFGENHNKNTELPDLLLIDGGKGHLSVIYEVLSELEIDIDVICIAKGKMRNAGNEVFHTVLKQDIKLERGSDEHRFMQKLRDEVHRFAITTHRDRRSKEFTRSDLENMEGIGPSKSKLLLSSFGGINGIKEATIEELVNVRGISRNMAMRIRDYFSD